MLSHSVIAASWRFAKDTTHGVRSGFARSALDHRLDQARAGTEGDLKMRPVPAASRSTLSVKVPPPSMPMGGNEGSGGRGHAGRTELGGHCSGWRPDILHDEQAGCVFANY
jgi:hypothetical protein